MVTVTTKEGLKSALETGEKHILCKGAIAQTLIKKKKRGKAAKIGGAILIAGGLIAAPFTGGLSAAGAAAGMGLTVGAITLSTGELIILVGGGVALAAILKGKKMKMKISQDEPGMPTVEIDVE